MRKQFIAFWAMVFSCAAKAQAGSLDVGFNIITRTDAYIFSTTLQREGIILIGLAFPSFGGTSRNRIARLNVLNTK